MNFQQAVQSGFSNYANFRGRACRSEFWWWQLFLLIAGIVAAVLDLFANSNVFGGSPLATLFWLGTIIPDLAVMVRRLHDTEFKWLVDFARFDPARRYDRLDHLVAPRGQQRLQSIRGRSASAGAEQAGGFVARKQIKQLPQGLPARRLQFRIAGEHQRCIVARCRQ